MRVLRTVVLSLHFFTSAAVAADYDVVILNGRVMDPETNFDQVANVGIKGERIVRISTEKMSGEKVIDARGHVVSAGFIDTQAHSHGNLFGVNQVPWSFML